MVDEHEGHEAAAGDWPAWVPDTSVWPVLAAVGAAGVYVGAAMAFIGVGADAVVPAWPGVFVAAIGALGFVAGLGGWTYDAFVADYLDRGADAAGALALRTAMAMFLVTEVATFGAGFAYYVYVRAGPWPPEHLPHLLSSLVVANTLVLVASSVTLHYAHHALADGRRDRFERLLGVTLALGVVFLAGQVYEYYEFVVAEGFTLTDGVFASAFYGLTGLHGLHVTLGAVLLGIVTYRARVLDQYAPDRDTSVGTVSLYWHFVDAVWLFLVAVLYVGAAV